MEGLMRVVATFMIACLSTAPVLAQPRPHRAAPHGNSLDQGPFTPEANRAFMGGGVVLEGAPGVPPPPPSAVLSLPPNAPPPLSR